MLKKGNKKVINAWAFYDWANSVYPLVITTAIFPMYYEAVTTQKDSSGQVLSDMVQFFGMSFKNTELYSYVISFSFMIVAFISPILSGVADYSDNKKQFLKFFCYLGSLACASLFFFDPAALEISMVPVVLASVGFWASLVFYNAYLPEIASRELHDKISAKGYALGYLGSSILLIICLVMIMVFDLAAKYSFLLVALWWVGFSQFTYSRLPNSVYRDKPKENKFTKGWKELEKVWHQVKQLKALKRYLASFFVYSMGVQTVMLMATLFAAKEINWGDDGEAKTGLIVSILIIQFIAIAGAYLFSWLSKKMGNVISLLISLLIWIAICVAAYSIHEPVEFYAVAGVVGLVMGGVQSLSRSTYSKLLPDTTDHASFFSFYDVLEKLGIVIGTFSYGFIEGITGSMRNSIFALATFFVVGMLLLLRVPRKGSIQAN